MEIAKTPREYLLMHDDLVVRFTRYEKSEGCLALYCDGNTFASATIHGTKVSDFYKAWRAMQCK